MFVFFMLVHNFLNLTQRSDNSSRQIIDKIEIDTDRGLHGGGSANKTESNFTCDRILNKQV